MCKKIQYTQSEIVLQTELSISKFYKILYAFIQAVFSLRKTFTISLCILLNRGYSKLPSRSYLSNRRRTSRPFRAIIFFNFSGSRSKTLDSP